MLDLIYQREQVSAKRVHPNSLTDLVQLETAVRASVSISSSFADHVLKSGVGGNAQFALMNVLGRANPLLGCSSE